MEELEHIGSILERVLWDIACKTPEGPAMYAKYVLPQLQRAKEEMTMTKVKRLQEEKKRLATMIDDAEAKASEARLHAEELGQRISDLVIRAQQGENVTKELAQAKRERSETLYDEQDQRRAAVKLKMTLMEAQEALRTAEKEAATSRYTELARQRKEANIRIDALTSELIKTVADLFAIDATQRLEAKNAGIITGRAAKSMLEDYLVYKLKPILGTLLPRVTQRGDLADIDHMAREAGAANG